MKKFDKNSTGYGHTPFRTAQGQGDDVTPKLGFRKNFEFWNFVWTDELALMRRIYWCKQNLIPGSG